MGYQVKEDNTTLETKQNQEIGETEATAPIVPETIIAITVLIVTFILTIKSHMQEILKIVKKTAQVVISQTKMISCNNIFQSISEAYSKMSQVITEATRTASRNRCPNPHRITNGEHHHTWNVTVK